MDDDSKFDGGSMAADMTRLQGEVVGTIEQQESDLEALLLGFVRALLAENGLCPDPIAEIPPRDKESV